MVSLKRWGKRNVYIGECKNDIGWREDDDDKEQLKQLIIDAHYAGVELEKLQEWIKEISADVKGGKDHDWIAESLKNDRR